MGYKGLQAQLVQGYNMVKVLDGYSEDHQKHPGPAVIMRIEWFYVSYLRLDS